MPSQRVRSPVEHLQSFDRSCIRDLREAGWTYPQVAAHIGHNVSVVCSFFQQWCVEHSHTRRSGSGRQSITDARQDLRIVRAALAARSASREEISAHVMSPRTIVNRLPAAGLRSRVTLAWVPLTQSHRQAQLLWCREKVDWRVEWRSVVFSDESRFCMRVMDVNVYGVYLVSVIF